MAVWTSCCATSKPLEYELLAEEELVDSETNLRSPPFERPEGSWEKMRKRATPSVKGLLDQDRLEHSSPGTRCRPSSRRRQILG